MSSRTGKPCAVQCCFDARLVAGIIKRFAGREVVVQLPGTGVLTSIRDIADTVGIILPRFQRVVAKVLRVLQAIGNVIQ